MRRHLFGATAVVCAAAALALTNAAAQTTTQAAPPRPMSPTGSAQAQVLGKWAKGERPAFTLGRENYEGGTWIEITYGRPLERGRELFGSGASYGKALNDVGAPGFPAPPVWRAGANQSTRLKTDVALSFGASTVPAGEYSLFIDLKPSQWTLIVSSGPRRRGSIRRTRRRCGARTATRRRRTSRGFR